MTLNSVHNSGVTLTHDLCKPQRVSIFDQEWDVSQRLRISPVIRRHNAQIAEVTSPPITSGWSIIRIGRHEGAAHWAQLPQCRGMRRALKRLIDDHQHRPVFSDPGIAEILEAIKQAVPKSTSFAFHSPLEPEASMEARRVILNQLTERGKYPNQ